MPLTPVPHTMFSRRSFLGAAAVAVAGLCPCAAWADSEGITQVATANDADKDGVDDGFEAALAAKHQPVVLLNREGVYRPVRLASVLPKLRLQKVGDGGGYVIDGNDTTLATFANHLRQHGGADTERTKVWSDGFNWEDDKPDPNEAPDLFWRVHGLNDAEVSLQYFWFCTFSDADFPADAGDHDGDWLCVDLTVSRDPKDPAVKQVVFHNHGRQLIVPKGGCEWVGDRLRVYAEHNSNELWPVAGKGEVTDIQKTKGMDARVVREHSGKAERDGKPDAVVNWRLVPVGEALAPAASDEATAFMLFQGYWGKNWDNKVGNEIADLLGITQVESPRSPRYQPAMWDRKY